MERIFCIGSVVLFLCIVMPYQAGCQSTGAAELQLRSDLINPGGYTPDMLPPSPVPVQLGFLLYKIAEVDSLGKSVSVVLWMNELWRDPRLVWDPSMFDNITQLHFPPSQIWRPDIVVFNSIEAIQPLADAAAVVTHDGTVTHIPPVRVKVSCAMDLSDYPYDSQKCTLTWGSWTHSNSTVPLSPGKLDMSFYEPDQTWELLAADVSHNRIEYPCCKGKAYDTLTLDLSIRRRTGEAQGRIAYSVVTSWLILVVFLVGPSSTGGGTRVIIGVLIFLALVILSASLASTVPSFHSTSLGRYLLAAMIITGLVTALNAVLSRVCPKGGTCEGEPKDQDRASQTRVFVVIDVVAFAVTTVLLAIVTGALFN